MNRRFWSEADARINGANSCHPFYAGIETPPVTITRSHSSEQIPRYERHEIPEFFPQAFNADTLVSVHPAACLSIFEGLWHYHDPRPSPRLNCRDSRLPIS